MYSIHVQEPLVGQLAHLMPDAQESLLTTTKQNLRNHLLRIGLGERLTSSITDFDRMAGAVLEFGVLPSQAYLAYPVVIEEPTAEELHAVHEEVLRVYKAQAPYFSVPFVVFTRGEDWWKGEPFFAVNCLRQYLKSVLYSLSVRSEEIRTYERGERTTRSPVSTAERAERADRYNAWLKACQDYRQLVADETEIVRILQAEAKSMVDILRAEFDARVDRATAELRHRKQALADLRTQGAPKWEG